MKDQTAIVTNPALQLLFKADRRARSQEINFNPLIKAMNLATLEGDMPGFLGTVYQPWQRSAGGEPLMKLSDALLKGDEASIDLLESAFPNFVSVDGTDFLDRLTTPSLTIAHKPIGQTDDRIRASAVMTPGMGDWNLGLNVVNLENERSGIAAQAVFSGFSTGAQIAFSTLQQILSRSNLYKNVPLLVTPAQLPKDLPGTARLANIAAAVDAVNGPYRRVYLKELRDVVGEVCPSFSVFLALMDEELRMLNERPTDDSLDLFRRFIAYRRKERYFEDMRDMIERAYHAAKTEALRQKIPMGTGATLVLANLERWYLPRCRVAALAVDGFELLFTLQVVDGEPKLGLSFRLDNQHKDSGWRFVLLRSLLKNAAGHWGFKLSASLMTDQLTE